MLFWAVVVRETASSDVVGVIGGLWLCLKWAKASQKGACTGKVFPLHVSVNWLSRIKAS